MLMRLNFASIPCSPFCIVYPLRSFSSLLIHILCLFP